MLRRSSSSSGGGGGGGILRRVLLPCTMGLLHILHTMYHDGGHVYEVLRDGNGHKTWKRVAIRVPEKTWMHTDVQKWGAKCFEPEL